MVILFSMFGVLLTCLVKHVVRHTVHSTQMSCMWRTSTIHLFVYFFYVHVVCYAYSTQLYYLRCTIRLFCSISAWILLANMFTVHRCTVCAILQKSLCFHPCVYIYEYVVGHVYSIHWCRWCTMYYNLYSIQYTSPCLLYMYEYVVSEVYSTQSYSRWITIQYKSLCL